MDQLHSFAPGELIGDFEVQSKIGENAFSAVYLVKHQFLGDLRAMRLIPSELLKANPDWKSRFQQAVSAAAAVHHPNIVEISGVSHLREQNIFSIIMEYLPEGNLLDFLVKNPEENTFNFLLKLTEKTASALAETAKHGLCHGHINPGNLLIDAHGEVKIADLGTIPLTPDRLSRYLAPEVLTGKADIRSDIYSLGMCLYHFSAGRMPYHAHEFFDKVAAEGLPEPHTLCPTIRPEINDFIVRLTQQAPEARPQTPEELLLDLAALRRQLNPPVPKAAEKPKTEPRKLSPPVISNATIQLGRAQAAKPPAAASRIPQPPAPPPRPQGNRPPTPPPEPKTALPDSAPSAGNDGETVIDELALARTDLPAFTWQQMPLLLSAYWQHAQSALKKAGSSLYVLFIVVFLAGVVLACLFDWAHQETQALETKDQQTLAAFTELQEAPPPVRKEQLRSVLAAEGDWDSLLAMSENGKAADCVKFLSSQDDPDALVMAATIMMLQLDGPHPEKDFLPLLEKAAAAGSPEAAGFLSSWHEVSGEVKKAKRYRQFCNEQAAQINENSR